MGCQLLKAGRAQANMIQVRPSDPNSDKIRREVTTDIFLRLFMVMVYAVTLCMLCRRLKLNTAYAYEIILSIL